MKRDALSHPKMLDFASRLDIPRSHAIGILTLLFDFTAQYAPQGDIGKHRNGAIARACEWMGNPDEFIEALSESGWIDASVSHRIRIHDWPEHCEQWVKLKLQKLKLDFLPEYSAEATAVPIAEASAVTTAEVSASRDLAQPSPSPSLNPNQAKSSLALPSTLPQDDEAANAVDVVSGEHEAVLVAWNSAMGQHCKLTPKRVKALKQRLKDPFWAEHWRDAIQKATLSDFCNGLGDKGWQANFEWFLREESVVKLVEGMFDNRTKPRQQTFADLRVSRTQQAIEEFSNG